MDTRRDQAEAPTEIPCPPPADARTRSRLPREERRGEILNAALAVFAELGYAQATLNDVAERVGVTKGCLYHHFESKEQLLVELIRERIGRSLLANEQLLASVGGSGQKALAALLEQMWEHFQQPGQIDVAILAINELPKVPEGGRFLFEEVLSRSRETLRRALQQTPQGDEMTPEEIERAAMVMPLMILGVALGMRVFRAIDPLQLSAEQVGETVTGMLLQGVGAGSGPGVAINPSALRP